MTTRSLTTLFLAVALLAAQANAFSVVPSTRQMPTPITNTQRPTSTVAFLKKLPNSMEESSASRCMGQNCDSSEAYHNDHASSSQSDKNAKSSEDEEKPKKQGYQRVEDWDADQKAGGMSWEQKVQFDGLRMGNGVRQNEILQRHLGSF